MTVRASFRTPRRRRGLITGLLLALAGSVALASPAHAAEGSIDHVEREGDLIQVLYSLPGSGGAAPDLDSVTVTMDGTSLAAEAELATNSADTLRRTTILAIDVSNSMRKDNRFAEAQSAAKAFLDAAPDDLYVGIVTFAGDVTVAQAPSLDRAESASVIDGLTLSKRHGSTTGCSRPSRPAASKAPAACSSSPTAETPRRPRSRPSWPRSSRPR